MPETEFHRVQEHVPSARVVEARGTNLDIRISEADLRTLEAEVVLLRTRVARFGRDLAAVFGDFEVAPFASSGVGLFHLGGNRFNAFRAPLRTRSGFAALDAGADMPVVAARLPSARLLREGDMSVVEVGDADFAMLLGTAEEA